MKAVHTGLEHCGEGPDLSCVFLPLRPLTPDSVPLVKVSVAQLCPTICDPMNCGPPSSSCLWNSPGKNTGVGSHFLLQGNFLT